METLKSPTVNDAVPFGLSSIFKVNKYHQGYYDQYSPKSNNEFFISYSL